jgi:RimJ/RimL family protein N-acetyltransferase
VTKRVIRKKIRRAPTRPTPKPRETGPRNDVARATPAEVKLIKTKATRDRGGGREGESWRIDYMGKRAGTIFINVIEEPPVGRHASVQIFLNKTSQGFGIGRIAYRAACESSAHDPIYAHMRKSNLPSRRAAEAAGFRDVTPPEHTQLIMKWSRAGAE